MLTNDLITERLILKSTREEHAPLCLDMWLDDEILIDFGYAKGGRKFTADIAQENIASNAVIKKLGFTIEKEGCFNKQGTNITYDNYTYKLDLE